MIWELGWSQWQSWPWSDWQSSNLESGVPVQFRQTKGTQHFKTQAFGLLERMVGTKTKVAIVLKSRINGPQQRSASFVLKNKLGFASNRCFSALLSPFIKNNWIVSRLHFYLSPLKCLGQIFKRSPTLLKGLGSLWRHLKRSLIVRRTWCITLLAFNGSS